MTRLSLRLSSIMVVSVWCFIILITVIEPTSTAEVFCGKGEYLNQNEDGTFVCKPCPDGTFESLDNHRNTDCGPCKKAESYAHEVELHKCTPKSDTVIGCTEGYFRQYHTTPLAECSRCSDCEYLQQYEAEPCGQFTDTVCCPKPGMKVVRGENGQQVCEDP